MKDGLGGKRLVNGSREERQGNSEQRGQMMTRNKNEGSSSKNGRSRGKARVSSLGKI